MSFCRGGKLAFIIIHRFLYSSTIFGNRYIDRGCLCDILMRAELTVLFLGIECAKISIEQIKM